MPPVFITQIYVPFHFYTAVIYKIVWNQLKKYLLLGFQNLLKCPQNASASIVSLFFEDNSFGSPKPDGFLADSEVSDQCLNPKG